MIYTGIHVIFEGISVGLNQHGVQECEFYLRQSFQFTKLRFQLLDANNESVFAPVVLSSQAKSEQQQAGPTALYQEEVVSHHMLQQNEANYIRMHCASCDASNTVTFIQKRLDEVATLSGLLFRTHTDENPQLSFCSDLCLDSFVKKVLSAYAIISNNNHQAALELPVPTSKFYLTLYADRERSLGLGSPVILQPMTTKVSRHLQRLQTCSGPIERRKPVLTGSVTRKWRGSRWLRYSSGHPPEQFSAAISILRGGVTRCLNSVNEERLRSELLSDNYSMVQAVVPDSRQCLLCQAVGDAESDGPGRLLCYGLGRWVHLNCMLWCFEVYESISGSLHNVDQCLRKAQKRQCSHCGRLGAGLPCYNPNCTSVYHVPCAKLVGCIFFTDRGMYCAQHTAKNHPMELHSLVVNRKVYITRNEQAQFSKVSISDMIRRSTSNSLVNHGVCLNCSVI
ncbi:Myeloid lymphoid or mixed-lineage leukemia 2 [Cichlidogyrus casuarinus]|uniref:Myeloid lymphoid or mixed-lineage leukemia 2 n=1 Tax=Cichlidogyrus casuarinus TaxID=1844966 RepID=A0ABD2PXZ8_9PLAT